LIRKIWRLNDLFGVIPAHAAERLSVIALEKLHQVAQRAKTLLDTNRGHLNEFLDRHADVLDVVRPDYGTIVFPRLKKGDATTLCNKLKNDFDTLVVPGSFFEMPNHFRIGIGGDTPTLIEGLTRISRAL
jgi:aspartate/methionine/tyrosine aminotransferase